MGDDVVFEVRITGTTWDDAIDYRGARYIIELQDAVNRLFYETIDSNIPLKDIRKYITVKVRVSKGSAILKIDLRGVVNKMVNKISGKQATFLLALTILTVAGYLTTVKVLDYKKSLHEDAQNGKVTTHLVEQLTPIIDKSLDIIQKAELEKPSRVIVHRLHEDDTITFVEGEELTASQAKERYPRKPRIRTESGIYDDTYKIVSIDFDKTPVEFTLNKNDFQFKAAAELSDTGIDSLTANFNECLKSRNDFNIDLQLFVTYNKRKFKSASITGIGEKRESVNDLNDIIATWRQ